MACKMGGCRCSYRDCTVRSDGKTHMFHFPVFDKVRCHQWITNAQKTDFLNLKLSQLKNRVICQNHFKDKCFMNETKGRLKVDALPTEDGPYCATKRKEQDEEKSLPINVDDIENDNNILCLDDKKASMSVKYGDFLTNDVDILTNLQNQKVIIAENNFNKYDANITHNVKNNQYSNQLLIRDALMVHPNDTKQNAFPYRTRSQPKIITDNGSTPSNHTDQTKTSEMNGTNNNMFSHRLPTSDTKIKILSHKKIITPVKIKGDLKPVTPSTIIEVPKRKELKRVPADYNTTEIVAQVVPIEFQIPSQPENEGILFKELQTNNENIFQSFNLENELQTKSDPSMEQNISQKDMEYPLFEQQSILLPKDTSQNIVSQLNNTKNSHAKKSISRNKLPPEKQAEIREKRKINMKIKDIINSCLNKIDEETINADLIKIIAEENEKNTNKNAPTTNQKAKSPLKNSIAILEAQLQRMENRLLNKIEQNSQKIIDLKKTLNPTTTKRSLATQTFASEDLHKKQLYREISKYLSPDANSLIYEELFINQYMEKKSTAMKKRKLR